MDSGTRFDEPPWFKAKVDQRIAEVKHKAGELTPVMFSGLAIVFMFLSEPEEETKDSLEKWEHTCDGCGAHLPNGLYNGHVARIVDDTQVLIAFGICPACKESLT